MHSDSNLYQVTPVADKELPADNMQAALSKILKVAAALLTTGMSGEISEWNLPKTTPKMTKLKIVQEADRLHEINRLRAIELKSAYDVLQSIILYPKTVIGKANELVAQRGKAYAMKYFQDRINEMGQPKDFGELYKQSGWITAVKHIKGCDYRDRECTNDGIMVNGVWVCTNHLR